MNKKSIAGLLLFGCLVMSTLIYSAVMLTGHGNEADANQSRVTEDNGVILSAANNNTDKYVQSEVTPAATDSESWLLTNPGDNGTPADSSAVNAGDPEVDKGTNATEEGSSSDPAVTDIESTLGTSGTVVASNGTEGDPIKAESEVTDAALAANLETGAVLERETCKLIVDSSQVDYEAYIPAIVSDNKIDAALNINNPSLSIKAEAAILFDADTLEVLYHKNPLSPVFPASTAKLLTCLVVLDWCDLSEEVNISNEIRLIARDSTTAGLRQGQILTIKNLLEGMLLPSGNDAAYAAATYVGRKSLRHELARREDAVAEFIRLMNEKAVQLGAVNSCFLTPDGYDAIGQYTTAYDMGRIGLAAMKNDIILEISSKGSSYNKFVSGDGVTWRNTNALIRKDSGRYYAPCIGLKTGTSTMAGKCLIVAGKLNGRKVLGVVMKSTQTGRWSDAKTLLDYGLN